MVTARELVTKNLSPEAYQYAYTFYWYTRRYLPRLVASPFVKRNPVLHEFPKGQPSNLVNQLRDINVAAPTEMCRVMTWNRSDKGHSRHNYTTVYSVLFGQLRDKPLRIFELGLGTNNPGLISSMGSNGRPGASLRGWRQLFPKATVFGADIDRDILFEEDGIRTYYCDQLDPLAIKALWSQPALQEPMDILIEDGLHTFEGNVSFLEGSLDRVRPGGYYVVEDIVSNTLPLWLDRLDKVYSKQYPNHEFAFAQLPNPANDTDNNLLIIRRRS